MIRPSPPIPDGSQRDAQFFRWTRDEILQLGKMQEVPGALVLRTTRGTAVIPKAEEESTQTLTGPLDQAIYVERKIPDGSPEGTKAKRFIYGVRGGYIKQFGATGSFTQSRRFAVPCFGDCSLCYDSVNDKIICSFFNEQRADDIGGIETFDAKKLYKVNPDTLLVEASAAILTGTGGGFPSAVWSGPHRLLFYSGKVIAVAWGAPPSSPGGCYLAEVDPVTLVVSRARLMGGDTAEGPDAPWTDIVIDSDAGLIWKSDSGDQAVQSLSLSDFSTQQTFFTNTTPTDPGAGEVATVTVDLYRKNLDETFHIADFGSFPSGYYLFQWKSGVIQSTDPDDPNAGKFFASEFTRIPPFSNITRDFNTVLNSVVSSQSVVTTNKAYDTAQAVRDANDGKVIGPSIDTFSIGTADFGIIAHLFADYPWDIGRNYISDQQVLFDDGLGSVDPNTGETIDPPSYVDAVWKAQSDTVGVTPCDRTYTLRQWDGTQAYQTGAFVLRSGTRYKAAHNNTNDDPLNASGNWTSQAPLYNVGDFIVSGGNEFQCTVATNSEPPSGSWTLIGIAAWKRMVNVVEDYQFSLIQSLLYGETPTPYNPYGVAWVPSISRLYMTTRTNIVLIMNPADSSFRILDLGELSLTWSGSASYFDGDIVTYNNSKYQALLPNVGKQPNTNPTYWATSIDRAKSFLPYCIRYDSIKDRLYIPTYKSSKIVVIDPQTNQVALDANKKPLILVGFDSAFDVLFTRAQDPAHPDDPTKFISSAYAVQHGDEPLKRIPETA